MAKQMEDLVDELIDDQNKKEEQVKKPKTEEQKATDKEVQDVLDKINI